LDPDTNELIYDEVKDHGKNAPGENIFKLDQVFFPINIASCHWTLGYVDMKKCLIYYYDLMCNGYDDDGKGKHFQNQIYKYLREEHISLTDWNMVDPMHTSTKGPLQDDCYNCRPFVVLIVDAICTLGVPPDILFLFGDWNISAKDMDTYRYRMGAMILKKDMPAIQNLPLPIEKTVTS
jgi:Ulp1 family protease